MGVVRTAWWARGPRPGNMGDLLTPVVLKGMGRPVVWAPLGRADLLALGSIVRFTKPRHTVWGSGAMRETDKPSPRARYLAVRGPLTRDVVRRAGGECLEVYGDPALLLPEIHNSEVKRQHEVGVVPHYVDAQVETAGLPSISPLAPDPLRVVDRIRACGALQWLEKHKPNVRWIPDRPIGRANQEGRAAPFWAACRTRRVVVVGPAHMSKLSLFDVAAHVVVPEGTAWKHMGRICDEVRASLKGEDELVLFAAGMASNVMIHWLWPELRGRATLYDIGAALDPYCGVFSRGSFREKGWKETVMPRNIP